jgi:hypothetical protein
MRYRITLHDAQKYEAVIFRDIDEPEFPTGATVTERKLISIANVRAEILEEMKENPSFSIVRIEEAPRESPEESY